jgi:hypothetical protein
MFSRLASNSQLSSLSLPRAGILGMLPPGLATEGSDMIESRYGELYGLEIWLK